MKLFRLFQPTARDHFYTTSSAEADYAVNSLGYTREGVTGLVFPSPVTGTIPLYRLYSQAQLDHFYTTGDPSKISGYVLEGIAGYVYPDAQCGATPLYRLYSVPSTDHFYTISAQERDQVAAGGVYTYEQIDGYILPA